MRVHRYGLVAERDVEEYLVGRSLRLETSQTNKRERGTRSGKTSCMRWGTSKNELAFCGAEPGHQETQASSC